MTIHDDAGNRSAAALAQRLRELRRRHFGARGKVLFAERLGLPLDEYERYERGVLPPGQTLVQICEATGEDLQWLLTGVAARGTVVISGARSRHRDLVARLANLLEERPQLAGAIEAFIDLLAGGERAQRPAPPALPEPATEALIPLLWPHELPRILPPNGPDSPGGFPLAVLPHDWPEDERVSAELLEPATTYAAGSGRSVALVTLRSPDGTPHAFVSGPDIQRCLPHSFGVRLTDDTMRPMFNAGDAILVTLGLSPKIGSPALCRVSTEPEVRCRVWLGLKADCIHLGRVSDGEIEQVPTSEMLWSLEALFRLAVAA